MSDVLAAILHAVVFVVLYPLSRPVIGLPMMALVSLVMLAAFVTGVILAALGSKPLRFFWAAMRLLAAGGLAQLINFCVDRGMRTYGTFRVRTSLLSMIEPQFHHWIWLAAFVCMVAGALLAAFEMFRRDYVERNSPARVYAR